MSRERAPRRETRIDPPLQILSLEPGEPKRGSRTYRFPNHSTAVLRPDVAGHIDWMLSGEEGVRTDAETLNRDRELERRTPLMDTLGTYGRILAKQGVGSIQTVLSVEGRRQAFKIILYDNEREE